MIQTRCLAVLVAGVLAGRPAAADEMAPSKPPLTKEQERERFHPRVLGMDAAPRLAGYARRLEMEKASPSQGLRFRNVGPEVQGGRIVDIEGIARRPDALLVAFASGGLWRTDNRGGSWTPLFDRESSITIGDVAVADPEARVIYVGTGENNSSRSSYAGTGVFKTTDGGKTWANVGLHDSHHIGRIIVDRANPEVVYVAALGHLYTENAERGVYKSSDGGRTWERVLFVDERTGAIDVVQHPVPPGGAVRRDLGARAHGGELPGERAGQRHLAVDRRRADVVAAGRRPALRRHRGPHRPRRLARAAGDGLRRHRQPVAAAGDRAPRRGHAARRAHRAAPARAVRGRLRAPRRRHHRPLPARATSSRRR